MTPKERAEELYKRYLRYCNELSHDKNKTLAKLMSEDCADVLRYEFSSYPDYKFEYWSEVKKEIKML